jgi:hypothetical protein
VVAAAQDNDNIALGRPSLLQWYFQEVMLPMQVAPALPTEVSQRVCEYLNLLDSEGSGFVHGVYLVGSVALGDYQEGRSDIDFVALVAAFLACINWRASRGPMPLWRPQRGRTLTAFILNKTSLAGHHGQASGLRSACMEFCMPTLRALRSIR